MSTDPLFMRNSSGEYFWYHNDHLGTPQMMTTSSGAVVWKAKYTSFGKADVDSGSTVVNPLRFPGQYEDAETGLHYNYFRYYDSQLGRYLRKDPIGFYGGDFNLFAYTMSNPLILFDPEGLSWLDWKVWDYVVATSDFWAGFGDTLTSGFGLFDTSLTEMARKALRSNDVVDFCSGAYSFGGLTGQAWGIVFGAAVGANAAGYKTLFHRYPSARGAGMTIVKRGKKLFGIEWHRFKIGSGMRGVPGKKVNRPHIDIPPKGVEHWPW